MVDICPLEGDPVEDYRAIRAELALYSSALAEKPELVVASKMDLTGSDNRLRRLRRALGVEVVAISAVTGTGLPRLIRRIWQMLGELPKK
jgi:GTP-binding protein